jgi:Flp pilus assembly protein TadG
MTKYLPHMKKLPLRRAFDCAKQESGVAVVEFALVAVLLMLLVFGIAQFGMALNTVNDETELASAAARYVAVNYNPGAASGLTLQQWVQKQADTSLLSGGSTVCYKFLGPAQAGYPVQIKVRVNFAWQPLNGLAALTGGAVPSTSTLAGSATMRLEANPDPSVYNGLSVCP